MSENLNPEVHYILGGQYAATIDFEGVQTWTLVFGVRDNDSDENKNLLLSKQSTPENIKALKKWITQNCAQIAPLFEDE